MAIGNKWLLSEKTCQLVWKTLSLALCFGLLCKVVVFSDDCHTMSWNWLGIVMSGHGRRPAIAFLVFFWTLRVRSMAIGDWVDAKEELWRWFSPWVCALRVPLYGKPLQLNGAIYLCAHLRPRTAHEAVIRCVLFISAASVKDHVNPVVAPIRLMPSCSHQHPIQRTSGARWDVLLSHLHSFLDSSSPVYVCEAQFDARRLKLTGAWFCSNLRASCFLPFSRTVLPPPTRSKIPRFAIPNATLDQVQINFTCKTFFLCQPCRNSCEDILRQFSSWDISLPVILQCDNAEKSLVCLRRIGGCQKPGWRGRPELGKWISVTCWLDQRSGVSSRLCPVLRGAPWNHREPP